MNLFGFIWHKRRHRISSANAMMLVRVHSNLRLIRKRKRLDIEDDENSALADDERNYSDSDEESGSCDASDSE